MLEPAVAALKAKALAAQATQTGGAGEAAIREVVTAAGCTRFRQAARTAFNLVYEIRP